MLICRIQLVVEMYETTRNEINMDERLRVERGAHGLELQVVQQIVNISGAVVGRGVVVAVFLCVRLA